MAAHKHDSVNREECTQTQNDRPVLGDPFQGNPLSLAWRGCTSENVHGRRRRKLRNACHLILLQSGGHVTVRNVDQRLFQSVYY